MSLVVKTRENTISRGRGGGTGTVTPPPSGPVTLFYDEFTGTDGTLLTAHTPNTDTVGGGWIDSGDAQKNAISSNRCYLNSLGSGSTHADVNDADVTLQADAIFTINSTNNALAQFSVRYLDASNLWRPAVGYINGTGNVWRISEVNGGVSTIRATGDATALATGTYAIEITASGTTIDMDWNGNTISYASATFNQTEDKHGVRVVHATGTNTPAIDNFKILSA